MYVCVWFLIDGLYVSKNYFTHILYVFTFFHVQLSSFNEDKHLLQFLQSFTTRYHNLRTV